MTTDAEDKSQSKFPRASLRARNKTLMITPADVGDFQVTTRNKSARESDLVDGLDDPLSALDDTSVGTLDSMAAVQPISDFGNLGKREGVVRLSSAATLEESLDDSLEDLSDSLGSSADEEQSDFESEKTVTLSADERKEVRSGRGMPGDAEGDAGLLDAEDIFAAPGGISVSAEELFSTSVAAPAGDPIRRGTRPVQSVLGSFGASAPSHIKYDHGEDSRRVGGLQGDVASGSILSAQENFQESNYDEAREYVDWKKAGKLIGFLVSYVSDPMGRYVELREGRLLVTSGESSSDSCLVILDESVSPMHAIMRISSDGAILILDQLSERGTCIRRAGADKVESLMGDKSTLCHGDVVIFGECEYHVVVMGAAALKRNYGNNE